MSRVEKKGQIISYILFLFNIILRAKAYIIFNRYHLDSELVSFAAINNYCNNYYKLSSLKQYSFIPLQSWRTEIQNQFQWAKVKVLARLHSLEVPWENLASSSSKSCWCSVLPLSWPLPTFSKTAVQHLLLSSVV